MSDLSDHTPDNPTEVSADTHQPDDRAAARARRTSRPAS